MSKRVREYSSGEEEPRPVRARLQGIWTNPFVIDQEEREDIVIGVDI